MKTISIARLLSVSVALFAFASTEVHAQATTGSLSGAAPPGATVSIQSDTGVAREVEVDERGRYQFSQLPLGTYQVELKRDGATVDSRKNILLTVNANTDVSFTGAAAELETIIVTGARAPGLIDVKSVDSRTVVTAAELERLPLQYSAEAIAKLAPGVVGNAAGFTGPTGESVVSFGGASAAENAYYINGFNTTDPLNGLGGLSLPYAAIDQQEIYTGGFSAKYGRSAGGVINAVGKRGTNEWKFGAEFTTEPDGTRSSERDIYYPADGTLYEPASRSASSSTVATFSAGGPIVKDRLFFFAAYQFDREDGEAIGSIEDQDSFTSYRREQPRWYAKLDWNISDSHRLEFTGASSELKTRGTLYAYDYEAIERSDLLGPANNTRSGGTLWSAKYTGYLTDSLTVSALYGRSDIDDVLATPGYDDQFSYVDGLFFQNPAYTGGEPVRSPQTTAVITDPRRGNSSSSLRFDVNWILGNHNLTVGIDNLTSKAKHYGEAASGPDHLSWVYGQADPTLPINEVLGVPATGDFANGEEGYYVSLYNYSWNTNVESKQTAQYIEDNWQVSDKFLLSLGVRLDQFTNYNSEGDAYIKQSSGQWAPRIGFSWDVKDDSSFKVFGNAGRYYLALPLFPAFGAAGAVTQTDTYYTYGGIDANGYPTDLTQMSDAVSFLNFFGNLPDPKSVASKGIEPSYQDEFILGFSKLLGENWAYGVKATYRTLKAGIDDFCDRGTLFDKAAALGYDIDVANYRGSCWLFNPGETNTFNLIDANGDYAPVTLTNDEIGFPEFKRDYYAVNFTLEHRFADRWFGKLDYTFSRSYGTTEGQVLSTIQQSGAAVTLDWDYASLMANANGPQNNDHTHQLKLYGYYEINPQWLVSANFSAISGAPKGGLGVYVDPDDPENTDPAGYGFPFYRFVDGQPAPLGSLGRMPWMTQLDLGVSWRPAFADGGFKVGIDVFNVFDQQAPIWRSPYSAYAPGLPSPLYGAAVLRQAPRSVRFGISYNF
ncbi:MAG: TonB-dependent receptor [Pseudomonadota bacterium]